MVSHAEELAAAVEAGRLLAQAERLNQAQSHQLATEMTEQESADFAVVSDRVDNLIAQAEMLIRKYHQHQGLNG